MLFLVIWDDALSQISIMSIPKMIKELSLSFSTPLPPLLPSPRPILSSLDASLMHVLHERERERERDTHTHTHTHRDTERDRDRDRQRRQTDTQTDRHRHRQRERQRSHTTSARVDRRSTLACGDPVICTTASAGTRRLHRGLAQRAGQG